MAGLRPGQNKERPLSARAPARSPFPPTAGTRIVCHTSVREAVTALLAALSSPKRKRKF